MSTFSDLFLFFDTWLRLAGSSFSPLLPSTRGLWYVNHRGLLKIVIELTLKKEREEKSGGKGAKMKRDGNKCRKNFSLSIVVAGEMERCNYEISTCEESATDAPRR